MFTYLHPDSGVKQSVAFLASLFLQSALLVAVCCIPVSQMSGPSLRSHVTHSSSVTPIYFHQDTAAAPTVPEPAPPAARIAPVVPRNAPSAVRPDAAQEVNTEAKATGDTAGDDSSGTGDEQGLAPFSSWRMNAMSSGFAGMHHQIKNALPVFTPEPPILHREVPEPARGKDVVLEVVIDEQGSIVQASVLQGAGYDLDMEIMQTLRRWIFVPAKINGVAVASRQQLRFHFPG